MLKLKYKKRELSFNSIDEYNKFLGENPGKADNTKKQFVLIKLNTADAYKAALKLVRELLPSAPQTHMYYVISQTIRLDDGTLFPTFELANYTTYDDFILTKNTLIVPVPSIYNGYTKYRACVQIPLRLSKRSDTEQDMNGVYPIL